MGKHKTAETLLAVCSGTEFVGFTIQAITLRSRTAISVRDMRAKAKER